jgi:peroxiredoxin Q/BCP
MLPRFLRRWIPSKGAIKVNPGQPAPSFSLSDDQGNEIRSEDLMGTRYLLWFYPKAATPG